MSRIFMTVFLSCMMRLTDGPGFRIGPWGTPPQIQNAARCLFIFSTGWQFRDTCPWKAILYRFFSTRNLNVLDERLTTRRLVYEGICISNLGHNFPIHRSLSLNFCKIPYWWATASLELDHLHDLQPSTSFSFFYLLVYRARAIPTYLCNPEESNRIHTVLPPLIFISGDFLNHG